MTGFGRNDQTALAAAGSSSAVKASSGKDTVKLTVDDAKKTAFDDAGVKEKDVVLKKAVLTTDDGTDIFEVEFYYKDFEYEYDIDPKTGIITDLDRDPMDAEDRAKMEAIKKKGSEKTSGDSGGMNKEKAFEIAIAHANVSASDTYEKKVKLEYDDDYGREVYEVEFKANGMEYSYDIDPANGKILQYESEPDD